MHETPPTLDLVFRQVPLPVLEYEEQLWVKATDLARALGYSSEEKVSRLYRRNEDEFTPNMTQVIEIVERPISGFSENLVFKTRIFSLRGCHLIAMLAHTPVAKEFRHWVLDILSAGSNSEFKWSQWAKAFGFNDTVRRLYFNSGRVQGQLDRFTPDRQELILKVCAMLDYGYLSQRTIAKKLNISRHVVGNIARRYHKGCLSQAKRSILKYCATTPNNDMLE